MNVKRFGITSLCCQGDISGDINPGRAGTHTPRLGEVLTDTGGTLPVLNVSDELILKITQSGHDGAGSQLAQCTQGPGLHAGCELPNRVEVFHLTFAFSNTGKDFQHTLTTHSARYALAAGLCRGERQEEFGELNHAGVFIHDDHATGPHHSADVFQGIEVYRDVEMLDRDTTTQRAACLHCLELLTVGDTTADVKDNLTNGDPHRHFNQSRIVNLAGESEDSSTRAALRPNPSEPLRASGDNPWGISIALDVVKISRLAPQSRNHRERRTGTRLTTTAFE